MAGNFPNGIAVDIDNNIWVADWGKGVSKFDGTNWTIYNTAGGHLNTNIVKCVAVEGTTGDIYFGTANGLTQYDGEDWDTYLVANTGGGLASDDVISITIDVYIGSFIKILDGTKAFGKTPKDKLIFSLPLKDFRIPILIHPCGKTFSKSDFIPAINCSLLVMLLS